MTEQEFKQALDEVVLKGINAVGAATVLGTLAIVTRFTEVIYDMDIVARLQADSQAAFEDKVETKKGEVE